MIEAPLALLEKQMEVMARDAVILSQMPLGLVPEVFDAVDVVLVLDEGLGVIDAHVLKLRDIENVVGHEAVRIDDAVRLDRGSHNAEQSAGFCVGDHHRIDPAAALEQS